jgi:hypothetical protein
LQTILAGRDVRDHRPAERRWRDHRPGHRGDPPPLHTAYVTAVTDALHPVFLAAAGAAALAFVLTWFLRELPLRATAHGPPD